MHAKINDAAYPCLCKFGKNPRITFPNVAPESVSGVISICSDDDGFIQATYDTGQFLRVELTGGELLLSNEPLPITPEPTIEDMRAAALTRIDGKCSEAIFSGFELNGKHYTATFNDQSAIKDALLAFSMGKTSYPYAARGETRTPHTETQITAIADAMSSWGIVNTGYYACLKAWIARESDADVLNGIDYGLALPDDLMAALTDEVAQYGININEWAGAITGGNT